jgi:uncharacterized repeat protein (TIGR03847 family)
MNVGRWIFDKPDRFVVGTIGAPGEREFYFQIRQGSQLISLATEKSQAAALADRISTIVREIRKNAPLTSISPSASDSAPLELPLDSEFTIGAIGIAFDPTELEIEISFRGEDEEQTGDDDFDELTSPAVEVHLDLSLALAFVTRTQALISAGRPLCPFCTAPIDPKGHLCPRANGYRR